MDSRTLPVSDPAVWSRFQVAEPNEAALVAAWLELRFGAELTTTSGQTVIVLEPGRRNAYGGPDIVGVSLYMNRKFVRGAVECHTHPQAWFAHGHAADPAYANVILHVVGSWTADRRQPDLPHVCLPIHSDQNRSGRCPSKGNLHQGFRLERLALKRWQGKVQKYRKILPQPPGIQQGRLIDEGCDLIGTKGNGVNFRMICIALDISRFCQMTEEDQVACLNQEADRRQIHWQTRGIRPAARARQRLPALAAWIRFSRELVDFRGNPETFQHKIQPNFSVGLAVELLGNIVLPYLAARAFRAGDFVTAHQAEIHWRGLRLPAAYGCWQRRFGTLFSQSDLKKFWISQALFALDEVFCKADLCFLCGRD